MHVHTCTTPSVIYEFVPNLYMTCTKKMKSLALIYDELVTNNI